MPRIMLARALLSALLAALPQGATLAAGSAAGVGAATGSYSVEYTGYSHGFGVLKLAGSLSLSQTGYGAHVTFHTVGMASLVVRSDNDSTAQGRFDGVRAVPLRFEGTGNLRGSERATLIEYQAGIPRIVRLVPATEANRLPVPADRTGGTMDTLSAVVMLIHAVATTGRCDGAVTTFDGRRLSAQTATTGGQDMLSRTNHSLYEGPALRCDFVGQQLAGFVTNEDQATLRKPRRGSAWLAPMLPGAPPVPVRLAFDNNILGEVTLYLTGVTAR